MILDILFQQLDNYSDQIASHFLSLTSLEKGDAVAIYMINSLEFIGTWLGLAKIGLVGALINPSLKLKPLYHSILASKAKVHTISQINSSLNEYFLIFKTLYLVKTWYFCILGDYFGHRIVFTYTISLPQD